MPPFDTLPVELFDQIVENVGDFAIGWKKACEAREALMAERGGINERLDEEWQRVTFASCRPVAVNSGQALSC